MTTQYFPKIILQSSEKDRLSSRSFIPSTIHNQVHLFFFFFFQFMTEKTVLPTFAAVIVNWNGTTCHQDAKSVRIINKHGKKIEDWSCGYGICSSGICVYFHCVCLSVLARNRWQIKRSEIPEHR